MKDILIVLGICLLIFVIPNCWKALQNRGNDPYWIEEVEFNR